MAALPAQGRVVVAYHRDIADDDDAEAHRVELAALLAARQPPAKTRPRLAELLGKFTASFAGRSCRRFT